MSGQEQSSSADKSHQPTPQKIRKSREKGEVAYSSEATTAATYIGFFVSLFIVAGWTATSLHETLAAFFHRPDEVGSLILFAQDNEFLTRLSLKLLSAVAPLFIILAFGGARIGVRAAARSSLRLQK